MHELSLAQSVMGIIDREMSRRPGMKLRSVTLKVGTCSGVEMQALATAMDAVLRSSSWPQAQAKFDIVEAQAQCLCCGTVFATDSILAECPRCGSAQCGIIAGTELDVTSLDLSP